jgi:glucose/arabinose dehydrogenase
MAIPIATSQRFSTTAHAILSGSPLIRSRACRWLATWVGTVGKRSILAPPGSNFGWPYLEGTQQTGGYKNLSEALEFYSNSNVNPNSLDDQPAVAPFLARSHGAPDRANAIMVGDFYNDNTLMFGDVNNGTLYAATLDSDREVVDVEVFDANASFIVDMEMGPDNQLYGVNLVSGQILRWQAS